MRCNTTIKISSELKNDLDNLKENEFEPYWSVVYRLIKKEKVEIYNEPRRL